MENENENGNNNVLPFGAVPSKTRVWVLWLHSILAALMVLIFIFTSFVVLPEMQATVKMMRAERDKEMERHQEFEATRKRHAVQAATLTLELERANEAVKRLNKALAKPE
jgi:cytochrome c biogenesis protein ResB